MSNSRKRASASGNSMSCHLADNFHPILLLCHNSWQFSFAPRFLWIFGLLSLSRSPFLGFTTLNLLPTELKLLVLEPLDAVLDYWASCPVSPRFTTTEEALQGLIFPSTSLITNQAVAPKCSVQGCLRCSIFAHWASLH